MFLTETKESLSALISTIATTHTPSSVPTFLTSILYSTLMTKKHEMDLLSKDITPTNLPILENYTLLYEPYFLRTPYPPTQHGTQVFHTPLKAEVLARQFEQSHHLTLNMVTNNHSLAVKRYVNRFFRSTTPQTSQPQFTNYY
jgi:hypothetical protein